MIKLPKRNLLVVLIASFLYNFMVIIFSFLLMKVIDGINQGDFKEFKMLSVVSIVAIVGQILFFALYNVIKGKIAERQLVKIRTEVLEGVFRFSISRFHKDSVDDYASFFYNDLGVIKEKYIYRIYDLIENGDNKHYINLSVLCSSNSNNCISATNYVCKKICFFYAKYK